MTKYLFQDKKLFNDFIERAAVYGRTTTEIVEKDYYVSLTLKYLSLINHDIVFKGGTSLSKAYQIIDRFSEDIDLSIFVPNKTRPNNAIKIKLKKDIIEVVDKLGFTIPNLTDTRSRRSYNTYKVAFESSSQGRNINENEGLRQHILLETYCHNASFPTLKMPISNYIYTYLQKNHLEQLKEIESEYQEIVPFEMSVQSLERTISDKIFAICDKWIDGSKSAANRHSRHLYDLYFLLKDETIDNELLRQIFIQVRQILKEDISHNPSSSEKVAIKETVCELLSEDFFKMDYHKTTMILSDTAPSYEDVKSYLLSVFENPDFLYSEE